MSKSSASSNRSELEARASFLDLSRLSDRIQGSSTPIQEHVDEAVVPSSDISDVVSYGSSSSSIIICRKPGRSRKSECQVPLEESNSSRSNGRSIVRPRSVSNPTPKKSNLEKIVAERLVMPSVRRSLSTAFAELNVDNEQSNDSSSLTGNEPPAKKYKSALKGHDWETFKSKHKDRIFAHVLNKPDDTLEEAKIWLQLYKQNAPQGVTTLIQFFADVCGYQDLNVSSIFKCEEENYTALRDYMQDKPPKYQKDSGKYLMKTTSNWGKQSQNAIHAFIQDLLRTVYNGEMLFDKVMLKHLFGVVMSLVYSTNLSMHHTGVVVVAKMYTTFLEIHVNIQKKLEKYRSESKSSTRQVNALVKDERLIFEILEKVQNVIEYFCCIQDPQLDKMEVTVIEEMFNWFKIYPSLLSSTKYIKNLMTFVEDQSSKVRSAALVVCHKLVKDKSMVRYMRPLIKTIAVVVEGRIRDVDYGISTDAAYICKDILLEYPNAMPVAARERLLMLVYCENHQLALAAGSFLHQTLCRFCVENEEVNSAKFIKFLIKFSYLETEEYVPLLVEALHLHSPQLHDWNTIIDLLLTGDLECKDERTLIDIMSHAVQQSITGKSKIARAKIIPGRPKLNNIRETWCIFLANLYVLLKKFSNHPKSVQMLCEILLVIDCSDRSLGKYLKDAISIIKVLQAIFVQNSDRELLITVSKALTNLRADLSVFKNRAIPLVDTLHQSVITALVDSIDHLSQTESPSEDEVKIEATTLKLSVLLMHQDLAGLIDQYHRDWLTLEDIITPVSMTNLITCGHWYMIWTLRKIITNGIQPQPSENLGRAIKQLKSDANEYIKACFNFIRHSKDFSICTEAFECICKVHMTFKQELKNPMKTNQVLKELLLDELDNNQLTLLMTFAVQLIFEEKDRSTLNTRRVCLGHILQLAYLHIIPFPELAKVYMHYHLHKDDYGDIFNNGLQVQKSNGLARSAIILPTLTYCYTNTDLTQNEGRDQLRKLTKEFQIFLSRSGHDLKLILQMGITYSVYSESRYIFLYYLKYFSKTLSPTDKKLISDFFLSKIPRGHEHHQIFKDFKRDLQNKQTTEPVHQRRLTTTTTSSYISDTEDIEYDTESNTSSYVENYSIDDLSDAI